MAEPRLMRASGAVTLDRPPINVRPENVRPDEAALGKRHAARRRSRASIAKMLTIAVVLIPNLWVAIYYGLIASDRYVSEAEFVVRGVSSSRMTGLDTLFRSLGIARTVDDTNVVESYILSRDAVRDLQASVHLSDKFSNPGADPLSRFPRPFWGKSFEQLYWYYLDRVNVVLNSETGISKIEVQAYTPQDAQQIARHLLDQAEALVNQMNERARGDAVRQAEADVQATTASVVAAQAELTNFRNAEMLVDPAKNSVAELGTITTLAVELDKTLVQISDAQNLSAKSPSLAPLQARADSLRQRIAAERSGLAGSDQALAAKVSQYERLTTLRDLADKTLAVAIESLESARQEARRKQIYVEEVVAPNLADESTEPRRLRAIVTAVMASLALLSVAWILTVGVKEHSS